MKKQDILKAFPVESNSVPETAINTNQYVKTNSIKRVQNYTDIFIWHLCNILNNIRNVLTILFWITRTNRLEKHFVLKKLYKNLLIPLRYILAGTGIYI